MIAPLAITLALAFWTPYAGGQPVCPQGVQIIQMAPDLIAAGNDGYSWMGTQTCSIQINLKTIDRYTIPEQCALVAHELGHNLFALEHQDRTIMDPSTDTRPVPGACYPPRVHKGQAWVRHHVRSRHKPDAAP